MFHRGHCNVNFIVGVGGCDSSVSYLQIGRIEGSGHSGEPWDKPWDNGSSCCRVWYWISIFWQNMFTEISTAYLWLFLEMNSEPWELYFQTCTTAVADQKLAESTDMICFFELWLLFLVSTCVTEPKSPQNWANDTADLACYHIKPAKSSVIWGDLDIMLQYNLLSCRRLIVCHLQLYWSPSVFNCGSTRGSFSIFPPDFVLVVPPHQNDALHLICHQQVSLVADNVFVLGKTRYKYSWCLRTQSPPFHASDFSACPSHVFHHLRSFHSF